MLSLLSPYSDGFVPEQAQVTFPAMLCDMFSDYVYKQPFHILMEMSFTVTLTVTPQQAEAVEMATVTTHDCGPRSELAE